VRLAVNLHEHLVHVPLQNRISAHLADPLLADPSGKLQAKSVPPKSNFLVADLDATLVQNILDIPKRKRKTNIHHDGQTDDLGARLKVAKEAAFCHPTKLQNRPALLNQFSSDSALKWVDWFNNRRLLEPIGYIPPAEAEERYYAQFDTLDMVT
jgi:hypothetical protein